MIKIGESLPAINVNYTDKAIEKKSNLKPGPLNVPEGVYVEGDLIAFGEDESYIHCIDSNTGKCYGIYKSDDENHVYQLILKLNSD